MAVQAGKKRIAISLTDEVLEKLEKLAKEQGISKSVLITLLVNEAVNKQ